MEWKTWSPLSGTPRPAALGCAAPAPAGHHAGPDGEPIPVELRRQLVRAVVQALTDQMELLVDDPG